MSEVRRASNGWAKILLNPGEASFLLALLDGVYKRDRDVDEVLPDLRSGLRDILPDLTYGDAKEEASRIAAYSGTWWDHAWGKTPWGREQTRKLLEKGPFR